MLTPLDIDNKSFKKTKLGGYDINDVEDFLVQVMEDYEFLYKQNSELKDKVNTMQESVKYYKSIEEGINKTIENAQRDAEYIKRDAELESKTRLEDLKDEIKKAEAELEEKRKQMQIYKIRVSSMLQAQLNIINEDRDV